MPKRVIALLLCITANISRVSAGDLIDGQPTSKTICKSEVSATFTVVGKSGYVLLYQWYRMGASGWEIIPTVDAKGASYTAQTAGEYRCEVTRTNTNEREISQSVRLVINDVPTITNITAPAVCNGGNLEASVSLVSTGGRDLQWYEWKLGGNAIESGQITGNTIPGLSPTPVTASQNGQSLTLTVANGCGAIVSVPKPVRIWATPTPPRPQNIRDYCMGEQSVTLSIDENNPAVWYNAAAGGSVIPPPTPDTNMPGTQTWWVSQKVTYPGDPSYPTGPTCESGRVAASVTVFALSTPPAFAARIDLCLNDPDTTLKAAGQGTIKWYDYLKRQLPAAPQINTSTAGTQTYYVTLTEAGKCESPTDDGKITVFIRNRADVDAVQLSYNAEMCPNSSSVIEAVSQVPNSTFRWYSRIDKTGLLDTGPTFTTPVLKRDTVYYVTVEYAGVCESGYPKAAVINVRDVTRPRITAPPNLVIDTDAGICYASGVETGLPLVSDNCTEMNSLKVYTDAVGHGAPTVYQLGDTTIIWWVMDESGNKDYALQSISVRDREKPQGTCPADIVKEVDENETSAVITYSLNYTDNCSAVKDTLVAGLPSGSTFNLGETLVRRLVFDEAGNTDTCEFRVIVRHPYRPMEVALRASAYEICPGQEVVITPIISGGSGKYVYSWKPNSPTGAVMRDYPTTDTAYEVTVTDGITTQTKNVQITVLETGQVKLTLEGRRMDEIFEGDEVLITATPGFTSYKLLLENKVMQKVVQEAGLNNRVSFQAELGTYFVQVFATDVNYCVSQDLLQVDVDSRKLPNVFTPNKDGKNEIFLAGFDLQVFSRTGELLYKGLDGWDGTYKGRLAPQGTYLYVVRRIMNNGEPRIFKGVVTLKL